jgi:hypothetical protein
MVFCMLYHLLTELFTRSPPLVGYANCVHSCLFSSFRKSRLPPTCYRFNFLLQQIIRSIVNKFMSFKNSL